MKALLLTGGSRGDLQPFVALACALRRAGHAITLAGPASLSDVVAPYGLHYHPIYDVTVKAYADPLAKRALSADGNGTILFMMQQLRANRKQSRHMLADVAALDYEDCEIVLHNHMCPGHEIAEKLKVPSVLIGTCPIFGPTSAFANPWIRLRNIPIPKIANRASYRLTNLLVQYNIGNTSGWRQEVLGLPHRRGHRNMLVLPNKQKATVLQPFSSHFLPPETKYPDWVKTTGFWFLPKPPKWSPPQTLCEFLEDGDPPVYIGFGSVTRVDSDPDTTTQISIEAARRAGVRAIVFPGLKGSNDKVQDKQIFQLADPVPFDWLFPRMRAIVHHGGTGTTAYALASARPQVLCPAIFEQAFNAERTYALGVSSRPEPLHAISAHSLTRAITAAITDQAMEVQAGKVSRLIQSEDGVGCAVKVLESIVETWYSTTRP